MVIPVSCGLYVLHQIWMIVMAKSRAASGAAQCQRTDPPARINRFRLIRISTNARPIMIDARTEVYSNALMPLP